MSANGVRLFKRASQALRMQCPFSHGFFRFSHTKNICNVSMELHGMRFSNNTWKKNTHKQHYRLVSEPASEQSEKEKMRLPSSVSCRIYHNGMFRMPRRNWSNLKRCIFLYFVGSLCINKNISLRRHRMKKKTDLVILCSCVYVCLSKRPRIGIYNSNATPIQTH